jgi:F-type H+-transporting ATPase subunit b
MNLLLAAADASDKLHALQSQFGIEGKYLLMQVISFAVLAFVLYRFFFKPVLTTIDERNRQIQQGLNYAEEMKAKLAAAQVESTAIIKQSQVEATRIIEDARKSAKEFLDRQTKEASDKASEMLAKGQQAIELEHRKMLAEARTEIARLVVTTTQRVLDKELTADERSRYTHAAARELTNV